MITSSDPTKVHCFDLLSREFWTVSSLNSGQIYLLFSSSADCPSLTLLPANEYENFDETDK